MTFVARRLLRIVLCACVAAVVTVASAAASAPAGVRVEHAWIRWLPAGLPAAGYARIVNDSDAAVSLTGASSDDYGMVMLHRSRLAEGDSTMEMVAHIDIPAHASVALSPGGYHLMLSHPTHALKPGDKVPMTLEFADGARLQADFPVLPANASGPAD